LSKSNDLWLSRLVLEQIQRLNHSIYCSDWCKSLLFLGVDSLLGTMQKTSERILLQETFDCWPLSQEYAALDQVTPRVYHFVLWTQSRDSWLTQEKKWLHSCVRNSIFQLNNRTTILSWLVELERIQWSVGSGWGLLRGCEEQRHPWRLPWTYPWFGRLSLEHPKTLSSRVWHAQVKAQNSAGISIAVVVNSSSSSIGSIIPGRSNSEIAARILAPLSERTPETLEEETERAGGLPHS